MAGQDSAIRVIILFLAKPENRKDYAVRMREFFDHHLMGKPAPDWWTEGVPHLKMDDHLKNRPKP